MENGSVIGPNAISPLTKIARGTIIFEVTRCLFTAPGLVVAIKLLGRNVCVDTTRLIAHRGLSNVCCAINGSLESATWGDTRRKRIRGKREQGRYM
jgi:hypothetical protein